MIDIIKTLSAEKSEKEELFGDGPWLDEPDFMEFVYLGYTCYVKRGDHGALCGYVEIPEDHPWEGKNYNIIPCKCHGDLTFCNEHGKEGLFGEAITLDEITREEGEPFIIGFDCSHFCDLSPGLEKFRKVIEDDSIIKISKLFKDPSIFTRVYRTINFVIDECKSIVEQAIEAQKKEK